MKNNKNKILLAVDDAGMRKLLVEALTQQNHTPVLCEKNALVQTVFDQVPNLIIVDEAYNENRGEKLALEVKEDAVLQYIPIILLTDTDVLMHRAKKSIDFVIKKSHDSQELLAAITKAIDKNYNELDLNPLTHLPGTRSSVLCIEHAVQSKKTFAVCCIDLSDLSAFNSAYGVARGDDIIIRLCAIAKEAIRKHGSPDDFLGHLGGDDFLIVSHSDRASKIAETIIHHFDTAIPGFYDPEDRARGFIVQRNKEGELTHYPIMGLSIAIVDNEEMSIEGMAHIGQIASRLKQYMKGLEGSCFVRHRLDAGKDGLPVEVCFPTHCKTIQVSTAHAAANRYQELFNTIISEKKIQAFYQPIVDMKTRKPIGYEALTRGVTGSSIEDIALLFAAARESGRIKELDKICVEYALKSGQALGKDQKLFLNLNHETLIDPTVMKDLFSQKGVIGFKNIVIEVTEQSILRSFDKVREALLELKEQGVSVAIDDVGGGAVSLRDVAILKPDYMKFDRSLIRQIDSSITKQQIVLSLKLFANGIQAKTTAEGIETKEEYEAVLLCGIELAQGYYFARPGKAFPEVIV